MKSRDPPAWWGQLGEGQRESPEHHGGLLVCPWVQGRVPEPSWLEQSPSAALEQAVVWVMWSRD